MKLSHSKFYKAIPIVLFILFSRFAFAQCTPPVSETVSDSYYNLICSLGELNGYSCFNSSTIPGLCTPVCSQGGNPNNTSWWAFYTMGGPISITLNNGTCNTGQGLEFGIWGDGQCEEQVACHSNPCVPPGGVATINANLAACRIYYFWIDGCNGDVCDFTLNTTGGGTPTLSPIGKINNDADMIIGPFCEGACNVLFYVDISSGGCYPYCKWTLDGVEVGDIEREIVLDLPQAGDFQICATAYIGNGSGIICAQQIPQCATVQVRRNSVDKVGKPRVLCSEKTKPGGFKWHTQRIYISGIYREQFADANCCRFDSVVEFTVLDPPVPEQVYYLTCDNSPYIDILGKKHFPCSQQSVVTLPRTTETYKCDSSILLTAVNVDYAPSWTTNCNGSTVELIPNVNILKPCGAGETYKFEYKWYKKNKPADIISENDRIVVPSVSEDYCLRVTVFAELEMESLTCTKIFCESIDESNGLPDCFPLTGPNIYCFDPSGIYKIDTVISKKVNYYTWTVDGGTIVSNADSSVVKVNWTLTQNDTGKICASYNVDCGTSCQKCLTVYYDKRITGQDFEHRGLSAYLDAFSNPNGQWRLISGPYNVHIEDPSNPRTKITAFNYGIYCFEWSIPGIHCTLRDTQCVELYSFKKASPEYPKREFDSREFYSKQDHLIQLELFTPNVINTSGSSFISYNGLIFTSLRCAWYDVYGQNISCQAIECETGIQRVDIISPVKSGFYFLLLELNGIQIVKKVCVLE